MVYQITLHGERSTAPGAIILAVFVSVMNTSQMLLHVRSLDKRLTALGAPVQLLFVVHSVHMLRQVSHA